MTTARRSVARYAPLPAVLGIAALTLTVAACGPASSAKPAHSSPPRTAPARTASASTSPRGTAKPRGLPAVAPAHIVIVMMENHSYGEVIGNSAAPFINRLARRGALFTNSHAVTHPSEPNYLALFSGSTQGVTGDPCPLTFTGPNLASELIASHRTFAGYAEEQPQVGAPVCVAGEYARKHVPWINFTNVPPSDSKPFSAFPAGFARLPTVSFVVPNLCHDMHDCPVAVGDAWLRAHLAGYATWAMTHHGLLIVDWDENDGSPGNQIPTIFVGQMVRPGRYGEPVTHYRVLLTIEALYHLRPLGNAGSTRPITNVWN